VKLCDEEESDLDVGVARLELVAKYQTNRKFKAKRNSQQIEKNITAL
jgi:hypothetical protein